MSAFHFPQLILCSSYFSAALTQSDNTGAMPPFGNEENAAILISRKTTRTKHVLLYLKDKEREPRRLGKFADQNFQNKITQLIKLANNHAPEPLSTGDWQKHANAWQAFGLFMYFRTYPKLNLMTKRLAPYPHKFLTDWFGVEGMRIKKVTVDVSKLPTVTGPPQIMLPNPRGHPNIKEGEWESSQNSGRSRIRQTAAKQRRDKQKKEKKRRKRRFDESNGAVVVFRENAHLVT